MRTSLVTVVVALGICAAGGCAMDEQARDIRFDGVNNQSIQLLDFPEQGRVPRIPIPPWPWRPKPPPIKPGPIGSTGDDAARAVLTKLENGSMEERIVKTAACEALGATPWFQGSQDEWEGRIRAKIPPRTTYSLIREFAIDQAVDKAASAMAGVDVGGLAYVRVCGLI